MWQIKAYDQKMLAHSNRRCGSCGSLKLTSRLSFAQIDTLIHAAVYCPREVVEQSL